MSRIFALGFGVFSYAVFFACFSYTVGFFANAGVPKSVDVTPMNALPAATPWIAALINIGLLGIFGLQHSVMARPAFKRMWTRIIPTHLERSVYVLLSVAAVALVFWGWQPIEGSVWHIENEIMRGAMWTLYLGGYATIFASTVLLNHFEMFGLRQVWLFARGREYTDLPFETPALYKHVRHPLYVGWFMALWFTPDMSMGHLLFAGVASAYILVALIFEERDLVAHFGDTYRKYQDEVPAFMPGGRNRTPKTASPVRG